MTEREPEILAFYHCRKCLEELPKGVSPKDWARLSVGWTQKGFQVWCNRHELSVINIDFLGQKVEKIDDDRTLV